MSFESANCPNCGAALPPSDSRERRCTYCLSVIIDPVEPAAAAGKVQLDRTPDIQAKLQRGRETGDAAYYRGIIDIDPNHCEARKALAIARNVIRPRWGEFSKQYKKAEYSVKKSMEAHAIQARNNPFALIPCLKTYPAEVLQARFRDVAEKYQQWILSWDIKKVFGVDFMYLDEEDRRDVIRQAAERAMREADAIQNWSRYVFAWRFVFNMWTEHDRFHEEEQKVFGYCAKCLHEGAEAAAAQKRIKKSAPESVFKYLHEFFCD